MHISVSIAEHRAPYIRRVDLAHCGGGKGCPRQRFEFERYEIDDDIQRVDGGDLLLLVYSYNSMFEV